MDPVQICEIKYSFASNYTSDKVSEKNSMVKEEIKPPVKEFGREKKKSLNFSGGTFYCNTPEYICT